MSLNVRNRFPAVDVLRMDYEYVTISYYSEGALNDLGEPPRTLTERSTNNRVSLDPLIRMPTYVNQSGIRKLIQQGITDQMSFFMILASGTNIQNGDIITDVDGTTYDVLHTVEWHSHKEAFLRKIT